MIASFWLFRCSCKANVASHRRFRLIHNKFEDMKQFHIWKNINFVQNPSYLFDWLYWHTFIDNLLFFVFHLNDSIFQFLKRFTVKPCKIFRTNSLKRDKLNSILLHFMHDLIEIWNIELEMTKNRNKLLFEEHSDEF